MGREAGWGGTSWVLLMFSKRASREETGFYAVSVVVKSEREPSLTMDEPSGPSPVVEFIANGRRWG
jgi:hypothetical protein